MCARPSWMTIAATSADAVGSHASCAAAPARPLSRRPPSPPVGREGGGGRGALTTERCCASQLGLVSVNFLCRSSSMVWYDPSGTCGFSSTFFPRSRSRHDTCPPRPAQPARGRPSDWVV
jgi:hypothetical protein